MEEKLWRFRPVTGPPEGIRAYYNRVYSGNGMGESDRFYEWILDLLAPSVGEMLADVCCGSGGLVLSGSTRVTRSGCGAGGMFIVGFGTATAGGSGTCVALATGRPPGDSIDFN